jgi:hypothetical protein
MGQSERSGAAPHHRVAGVAGDGDAEGRKGGNVFDPNRAKIVWRSSALALAAGMDDGWPGPDEVYMPQDLMEQVIARTVAGTNIANAEDAGVELSPLVRGVAAMNH